VLLIALARSSGRGAGPCRTMRMSRSGEQFPCGCRDIVTSAA
jgi:hypothetical protein